MEPHQTAIVFGDGSLEVVVPDFATHAAEEFQSVEMAAHECFETLAVLLKLEIFAGRADFQLCDQLSAIGCQLQILVGRPPL